MRKLDCITWERGYRSERLIWHSRTEPNLLLKDQRYSWPDGTQPRITVKSYGCWHHARWAWAIYSIPAAVTTEQMSISFSLRRELKHKLRNKSTLVLLERCFVPRHFRPEHQRHKTIRRLLPWQATWSTYDDTESATFVPLSTWYTTIFPFRQWRSFRHHRVTARLLHRQSAPLWNHNHTEGKLSHTINLRSKFPTVQIDRLGRFNKPSSTWIQIWL